MAALGVLHRRRNAGDTADYGWRPIFFAVRGRSQPSRDLRRHQSTSDACYCFDAVTTGQHPLGRTASSGRAVPAAAVVHLCPQQFPAFGAAVLASFAAILALSMMRVLATFLL